MQDLELVGVHDDGEHVLLTSHDGSRYLLSINEPLRAAVRRDRARLGQLQIAMDGGLRPRDIQSRIRGGQSAAEIAELAGLPLEHVRRYEGPVLAEREEIARRARNTVTLRGAGGDQLLDDLVAERMAVRGVGADRSWDAWRDESGSWVVQVEFTAASKQRVAQWRFDATARTIDPLDDEARWLSGRASADSGPLGGRRLSAVRGSDADGAGDEVFERVYDIEADGGVRESVADQPVAPRTVDILDALRGRRGRRQPVDDAGPVEGVGVPMQTDLVDHLLERGDAPAAHPPASRPDEATDAEILALPEPAAAKATKSPAKSARRASPRPRSKPDEAPAAEAPTRRRSLRAATQHPAEACDGPELGRHRLRLSQGLRRPSAHTGWCEPFGPTAHTSRSNGSTSGDIAAARAAWAVIRRMW